MFGDPRSLRTGRSQGQRARDRERETLVHRQGGPASRYAPSEGGSLGGRPSRAVGWRVGGLVARAGDVPPRARAARGAHCADVGVVRFALLAAYRDGQTRARMGALGAR